MIELNVTQILIPASFTASNQPLFRFNAITAQRNLIFITRQSFGHVFALRSGYLLIGVDHTFHFSFHFYGFKD
jgi:hypothetical protein